ncbi:MAG: efflux RND transporter permease subunit [Planctomycetota bacterium]
MQDKLRYGLEWLVDKTYRPVLALSMRYRYLTMATAFAISLLTIAFVKGGHIRVVFFPAIDADTVTARLQMAGGTSAAQTSALLEHLARTAEQTRDEFDAKLPEGEASIFRNLAVTLGSQPFGGRGGPHAAEGASGSNSGEVTIELTPGETRSFTAAAIVNAWRAKVGDWPGINTLTFSSTRLAAGDDISVELAHADFEKLLEATEQVKLYLAEYNGVNEIADSFEAGKRELNFELTEAGVAAGLTRQDLARQVRQAYYGAEAQRVQRGRDDIKVLVRYTEDERRSLASLDDLRIRTPSGKELPLATVASYTQQRGYSTIQRTDRRRIVRVTADVDEETTAAGPINAQLRDEFLPRLRESIPGLSYSFEGTERERMESIQSLARGLLIALFGIFALLAVQLRSYTKPLVVLAVIPLGFVGAVFAHALLGYAFDVMVALPAWHQRPQVDLVNRRTEDGDTPEQALLYAGPRRFRPRILFTSLTTCVAWVR